MCSIDYNIGNGCLYLNCKQCIYYEGFDFYVKQHGKKKYLNEEEKQELKKVATNLKQKHNCNFGIAIDYLIGE